MATESILEQYRIHDFIAWQDNRELELNPHFQRRSVWDPQARTMLIDSVLRRMPIPKVYMRTRIDTATRRSVREVVDGQQRLRAILGFANDEFALTRRAGEFAGLRYSTLPDEAKSDFLSYAIAVDSLINASDSDVLEVFARLNSYNVSLNAAEKRHAKFQGDFKWAVHGAARDWALLWEDLKIVGGRDRLRMGDDAFMAELFSVLMEGVTDGGATQLDRLYAKYESDFEAERNVRSALDETLSGLLNSFGDLIKESPLSRAPQFLLLFAAFAALKSGIPEGQLGWAVSPGSRLNSEAARDRLRMLADALEAEEPVPPFDQFVDASKGSTQRIATRRLRFTFYEWALTGGAMPKRGTTREDA